MCEWVGDWSGYGLMLRWGTKYYLPWLLPLLWVPTSQHSTKKPKTQKHEEFKQIYQHRHQNLNIFLIHRNSSDFKGAVPIYLKIPKRNSFKNLQVRDQSNTSEVSKKDNVEQCDVANSRCKYGGNGMRC